MEIRHLREFLVLATKLNFSRAAEQLNMTQPVLSRHIKFLEDHLGVQLLRRNTHRVEMTSAGQLFADEAGKVVAQYDASISAVRACATNRMRPLSIAFLGDATKNFLSSFLTAFAERHPDIPMDCCDADLDVVVGLLEQRCCDMAFVIRPNEGLADTRFSKWPIFSDPLRVVMNRNHPLANSGAVSIRELTNWPLIGMSRQGAPTAWRANSRFLERYGIEYRLAKECPNLETCCFNIEFNDRALMLLPDHRRYMVGANSVLLPLVESDCWFHVELVWDERNTNLSVGVFLNEFRDFSAGHSWQKEVAQQPAPDDSVIDFSQPVASRDATPMLAPLC